MLRALAVVALTLGAASPPKAAEASGPGQEDTMKGLLSRHVAFSLVKQLSLKDAPGLRAVDIDLEAATVKLKDGTVHPIQVVGTRADNNGTWLWSWANPSPNWAPAVKDGTRRLREIGLARKVPELSERMLQPGAWDGHSLSLVACGLLGGGSYFSMRYDGGEIFFLNPDVPAASELNLNPERLATAIHMAISSYELDHRQVLLGLAEDAKLKVEEKPGWIKLRTERGDVLEFRLDDLGRIAEEKFQLLPRK
jgi:hypothetical protein